MNINLSIEIHCQRPSWIIDNINPIYREPKYRIYVNNDLITERTWIWDNNIYLSENIHICINPTENHCIRLFSIQKLPEQAKFVLKNFKLKNENINVSSQEQLNDLEINFSLR